MLSETLRQRRLAHRRYCVPEALAIAQRAKTIGALGVELGFTVKSGHSPHEETGFGSRRDQQRRHVRQGNGLECKGEPSSVFTDASLLGLIPRWSE